VFIYVLQATTTTISKDILHEPVVELKTTTQERSYRKFIDAKNIDSCEATYRMAQKGALSIYKKQLIKLHFIKF